MTNKEIARVLKETSALVELTGGNPFRARAFSGAARKIERLEERALDLLEAGTLTLVDGIGKGLTAQIEEIGLRGSFDARDDLLNALPHGLLDVLRIKGLGAKKVRVLWQELGITDLEKLEGAAASGQIASLSGFGKKSAENILNNITLLRSYSTQRRLPDALLYAQKLCVELENDLGNASVAITGSLRRKMPVISCAEILVASDVKVVVEETLQAHGFKKVHSPFDQLCKYSGSLEDGLVAIVWFARPSDWGYALAVTTGNQQHVASLLQGIGSERSFRLETEVYEAVGISFVPPPLRDLPQAYDWAVKGTLPQLIQADDIKGTIHNHSTWSDGAHSLADMAEAARMRGMEYLGICDHSRSLKIANGLSIERVIAQHQEIDALNAQNAQLGGAPCKILKGIESDILADGSLDYPDEVLATFDLVVASIHSRFNMSKSDATHRLIKAISHPSTTILGHPTGRLLLAREGYPIDHEAIIDACAEHCVAIELNANPYRLDIDWRWIAMAMEKGVYISINPDAHAIEQLDLMSWGVQVAQKGGLTAKSCLNALGLDALQAWLDTRRSV